MRPSWALAVVAAAGCAYVAGRTNTADLPAETDERLTGIERRVDDLERDRAADYARCYDGVTADPSKVFADLNHECGAP